MCLYWKELYTQSCCDPLFMSNFITVSHFGFCTTIFTVSSYIVVVWSILNANNSIVFFQVLWCVKHLWNTSPHTHTATHCDTLQHTATHCNRNTSPHTHTATHCNTLQHTATHCNRNTSPHTHTATHCDTLQHTATHCNTLQHTATHCSTLQPISPYMSTSTYINNYINDYT